MHIDSRMRIDSLQDIDQVGVGIHILKPTLKAISKGLKIKVQKLFELAGL